MAVDGADAREFCAASSGSFSAHSSRDKAFEIFVKRTITSIQKEAWGRSKEVKEIREACQSFLNSLDQNGCTEETLKQVLYPLQLACASNMQKVVELALGCLHKLVAHAWLHGESTAAGTMDILSAHGSLDDDDTVANVIKMVIKCGETTNEALQLAVVRALLTFTTAEHFIAHGECLLSAVRAVFNLALGAENPINKRTASNALLQMLNTICKRVTQIQPRLTGGSSECSSRTVSEALELYYSVPGAGFHNHSPHSGKSSGTHLDHMVMSPPAPGAVTGQGSLPGPLPDTAVAAAAAAAGFDPDAPSAAAAEAAGTRGSGAGGPHDAGTGSGSSGAAGAAAAARAAQLAELAEKKDLRGLEAALEAAAAAAAEDADDGDEDDSAELRASSTAAVVTAGLQTLSAAAGGSSGGAAPTEGAAAAAAAAAGANGMQQASAGGAPGLPPHLQQQPSVGPPAGGLHAQSSWHQQQYYQQGRVSGTPSYAGRGGRHGNRLTTQEKDVLLVLTAFCKLASREVPGGAASGDSVLAQGKLLALEMLGKVLSNPMHNWDHVPESFCRQLRQPLCMALLRNCATPDSAAYGLALKLLMAILNLPRVRLGLRAELGAFYPLLVLRYLEQQQAYLACAAAAAQPPPQQQQQVQPPDPGNVTAALSALHGLLADPQLLVDLFVNFDCDLQAANLFERTVQVLSGLAAMSDGELEAAARADKRSPDVLAGYVAVRKQALSCCLQVIAALENWAKPIKDAALRAIEGNQSTSVSQGGARLPFLQRDSASSLTPGPAGSAPPSEVERLAAAKSTKELLAKGISLFNTKGPLKGIESLIANNLVESAPAAVAAFLRAQQDNLDKTQLGELLGHHEDFAVAVMHAWVDSEPSMAGQAIDQSLRRLLSGFRLPGEAQKIDRIMEKFAERYCKDNPSRFHNADGAYMLSFCIIMLNTDAHNPLAERRLGKADFVAMNHSSSSEEGGMVPVLPVQQLEEIYDRVVREEILVMGESRNNNFSTSRTTNRNRLAAAIGWTTVLQPFKALAGGSNKAGAGKDSAHAQRRYLQELAEREVVRAAASGNMWFCASHPEHVRPMLQVGFPVLLQAVSAAFTSAPDAATAARLLAGLLQLTKLCGLLGLDRQCEAAVGVLAARSGVFNPAPPGTLSEAKQLSALQALLSLTSGPEAGFLGSSWVIILRAISALDALKQELTRPSVAPLAPASKEPPASGSNPFSRMFQSMFGSTGGKEPSSPSTSAGGAGAGASAAADAWHSAGAPGSGAGSAAAAAGHAGVMRDSLDGSQKVSLAVRDAPGAGLVLWAESAAGAMELERPYAHSTNLDGDAVVVFMRALCAVSQEELEAGSSSTAASAAAVGGSAAAGSAGAGAAGAGGRGVLSSPAGGAVVDGPRLYSLQKVVECAYHNMDRIRLVWGKLWAVIAAQLVGASCHPHRRVALYAVDSLRQLVAKLLARAELEHYTHQEEALRPFVAVLRQCDEACVRELAVQCVMQAVTSHPGGLGSGWRMVILALRLGAADGSPAVMAQTQEALQVVVDTLYAGTPDGSSSGHGSGHTFLRETVQAIVAGIRNPAHQELSISAVQLLGGCGVRLAAYEDAGGKEEAPAAAVAAAPGGVDLDGDYGWGLLLRTLADVLQHDRRPAVVDASLDMVFGLLGRYSQRWDAAAWRVLIQRVVRHMLLLPPGLSPPPPQAALDSLSAGQVPAWRPLNPDGASRFASLSGTTGFGSPVVGVSPAAAAGSAGSFGSVLQFAAGSGGGGAGGAVPVGMSVAEQGLLVTTMLKRMDSFFPLLCDQAAAIRAEYKTDMVQQLVAIGVSWYQQNSLYLSTAGVKALMRLAQTLAAGPDGSGAQQQRQGEAAGWRLFVGPIAAAVQADVQQIMALATKQLAESAAAAADAQQQQQQQGPAGADKAGAHSSFDSPRSGSPRNRAPHSSSTGAAAGAGLSPLGSAANAAKGGIAARQAAAAAAATAAVAAHIRVRTRQLVLLQRGLAAVHRDCMASMSWEEQMQLLDALALGVEAAIAFNTDLSVAQQRRQQRRLLAASPRRPEQPAAAAATVPGQQQQQQQQQHGLQAVPEGAATADPAALHESIDLASAVAPDGGAAGGAAAGADVLLPFGSSIRFSDLSLSQKSSGGGSAAGSTAVSSAGGSLAGAGAAAGAGLGPGAADADGSPADPFFQMRSTSSGTSGGGGAGALLLSRSTSAGSTEPFRGRSIAAGAGGEEGPVGFGSIGGADGSDSGAAASAQPAEQQQGSKQAESEITPLSPTGPQPLPHQPQQPSQQPEEQARPNLPHVRTSLPGQAEARGGGGGGFSSSSPTSSSPLRQRLSGVGSSGSPGRMRMGSLVLPQLLVSSPESVEVVQPAFMRLEAEGGLLLIQALTLSLQSAAQPSRATAAAQQRLLQLVRCVIESEAASSSVAPYSPCKDSAGEAHAASWTTGGSSSSRAAAGKADNALQDAVAGVGWEHAARAPLVVAALQVLSELQGQEYTAEVLHLFPALCRLMSSSHQLIRAALSRIFNKPDFLLLLPAAAGAAAAVAATAGAADVGVGGGQQQSQQQWQQVSL